MDAPLTPDLVRIVAGETQGRLLGLLRRSPRTITELSVELGLTDNAIRTHIAALSKDGFVAQTGMERETGGKPARRYALTPEGEELFPKAYAAAFSGLVEEIVRVEGWERAVALLRGVGTQAAARIVPGSSPERRIEAAAEAVRGLGADIEVERLEQRWLLRGYACPLASVTARHPQVCSLVTAFVGEITGGSVEECCERGERPRCRFAVSA
jgi:predicted ArsR family transcriptional regulator